MKCYLKKMQNDRETWFAKHLGIDICPNKWVIFRQDAKEFGSVKEARKYIKMYNLKNCEVEYERK